MAERHSSGRKRDGRRGRRKRGGCGEQWWEPHNVDVYKDWFRLGAVERRTSAKTAPSRRQGGAAEKGFSGVDQYIRGLQKIGSMPVQEPREALPFDHTMRHDFHRIPGYAGFCPGDKCLEKVTMMRNGPQTARLGQLLSRNLGNVYGGGFVDAPMPRTVADEVWSYKINSEPLTQFSRVRTDVWPTVKDTITGS